MASRGSIEVHKLRTRLNATFQRASTLKSADSELQSDFAKYLCILVSAFVESVFTELAIEHCRSRSSPTVLSYATTQLDRIQNLNSAKLSQALGSFDKQWMLDLSIFISGPRKDALDSVLGLRNAIAHGDTVSITLSRILNYYNHIDAIMEFVEEKLA